RIHHAPPLQRGQREGAGVTSAKFDQHARHLHRALAIISWTLHAAMVRLALEPPSAFLEPRARAGDEAALEPIGVRTLVDLEALVAVPRAKHGDRIRGDVRAVQRVDLERDLRTRDFVTVEAPTPAATRWAVA